jgi:hypothetical protein
MPQVASSSVSVPVATEYVIVEPKIALLGTLTPQNVADFQRDIMLQAQGDTIELSDGMPPLLSALTFATVYDIAMEAVFRLNNGTLVLLFDHQANEPLRPKVDESVWTEMLKVKNKNMIVQDVSCPTPEVTLDLSAIWSRTREHDDIVARTKLFIKSFTGYLQPSLAIHLRGEIPCLPLFVAVYLIRPYGHTIDYIDAQGVNITLFS